MGRTWSRLAKAAWALAAVAVLLSWPALGPAQAGDISGCGATFPYPLYAKWSDAYKSETGTGLNYQSVGSGKGIVEIKARRVTFGASDAPLMGRELEEAGLVQFPMTMGGIVPVVNLEGLKPGDLVIDGPTLANVFLGRIKRWDDPAMVRLNPNLNLPNREITLVHRADGSGTTYNFTYYLSEVSREWKTGVGTNTAVQWPGGLGADGNAGVAATVGKTPGSMGYVEYAYAKQNKLAFVKMINRAGQLLSPTTESFQAAAANADWKAQPGYGVILANQPGASSWPMTAATWILVPARPKDPAALREALKFFAWAYESGGNIALSLDYVPIPTNIVLDIENTWATAIRDQAGQPVFVSKR
jgi:phosphate transport system substrate-binding protein